MSAIWLRLIRPFFLILFFLLVDFSSKLATHLYIPLIYRSSYYFPYGGIAIFKDFLGIEFSITHQTNTGAAWGMLSAYPEYLAAFRLLFIGALVVYFILYLGRSSRRWPFALIIAGALGNVLDYFLYGHVIDMFHFKFWGYQYPIFNLADSYIFCGVAWLLFLSLPDKSDKNIQTKQQ